MVMVVECESCHSRFRVKKSLLDSAFAIRFRCRTCDGFIVVRNPEMRKITPTPSTILPASTDALEVSTSPSMHPEPEMPSDAGKPASPTTPSRAGAVGRWKPAFRSGSGGPARHPHGRPGPVSARGEGAGRQGGTGRFDRREERARGTSPDDVQETRVDHRLAYVPCRPWYPPRERCLLLLDLASRGRIARE